MWKEWKKNWRDSNRMQSIRLSGRVEWGRIWWKPYAGARQGGLAMVKHPEKESNGKSVQHKISMATEPNPERVQQVQRVCAVPA